MADLTSASDASASPAPRTASELAARLTAERAGQPFLMLRDSADAQLIQVLPDDREQLTVGRDPQNDLALAWDAEVSRVHAELVRVGQEWVLSDQGISRNGSYLNGQLVGGRQRLKDGDLLRFGRTLVIFVMPQVASPETTLQASALPESEHLSAVQRRILAVLCRPLMTAGAGALPASNQEIADAVHLSVQGVKSQLRTLTERFGYGELPQNRKRLALAERAVRMGLGSQR